MVCGYAVSPDAAADGTCDVLILDDVTSFISPLLISRVHQRGTQVIGIYDPADGGGTGARLLESYGVDRVLSADASTAELLAVVHEITPDVPPTDGVDTAESPPPRRAITAVTSATGGAGATEVALAIATAAGPGTVLVDADTLRPALAQRLRLDLDPNLLTAVDSVMHNESPATSFVRHPDLGTPIVVGVPDAGQWSQLRPGEVAELLWHLSADRDVMVVAGGDVEELPGPAPRFALARSIVALADSVVLVTTADPIGARRAIDWLAHARPLLDGRDVVLVINKCTFGRSAADQLQREIERNFTCDLTIVVEAERRVQTAAWRSQPVVRGSMWRAGRKIAATLIGGPPQ